MLDQVNITVAQDLIGVGNSLQDLHGTDRLFL
jgi:hypothetical protein